MVTDTRSKWDTDTGLPDDCDIWITRSRFGTRANYLEGKAPLLIWDVESPDYDFENGIIWSVGKNWDVSRDGAKITHKSNDPKKRVINSSMMGQLINRLVTELKLDMSKYGDPYDAQMWEGLGFHMRRQKLEMRGGGGDSGVPASTEHLMPVAFLGVNGEKAEAAPAPATTGRRAVRVAPPGRAKRQEPDGDDVRAKVTKLALAMDDETDFQKAAINMGGVSDDADLMNEVMESGDEGFYAKARA